jgi:hypothetical protein
MMNEPVVTRRGSLKNGNPGGDLSRASRCGAMSKRHHRPCRGPAMPNGRCRLHGGPSTGPRTAAGLERSRRARWKHGAFSRHVRDMKSLARQNRLHFRRLIARGRELGLW